MNDYTLVAKELREKALHLMSAAEALMSFSRIESSKKSNGRAAEYTEAAETTAPAKRHMSAAARRRIGAAQRKRWAAVRKAETKASKK